MADFFISYNKADSSWAQWIAWQLEEEGFSTIIQQWDFRPGANFVLEMHKAAADADRTIGVLSNAYLAANYTSPEWAAAFAKDARGRDRKLVLVRVGECQPDGILSQIIHIDLVGLSEPEAKQKLIDGLTPGRAKPNVPPSFPAGKSNVMPKREFPGGARPKTNITPARNATAPLPAAIQAAASIDSLISRLQDHFFFRWEPGTYGQNASESLLYWPVTLRAPTPIHAAQTFAAAGLQKLGAKVMLWLDDLGNIQYRVSDFTGMIKQWLERVGGDADALEVKLFSSVIEQPKNQAFEMVQRWLGTSHERLESVLRLTKLWPKGLIGDQALDQIARGRPRRLLTPAMVWSSLAVANGLYPSHSVITLGGVDESPLWELWRHTRKDEAKVGHLYVPELRTVTQGEGELPAYMGRDSLAWKSKQDILNAIRQDVAIESATSNWADSGRLSAWILHECALLPAFVGGFPVRAELGTHIVSHCSDLRELEPLKLSDALAELVARWIL